MHTLRQRAVITQHFAEGSACPYEVCWEPTEGTAMRQELTEASARFYGPCRALRQTVLRGVVDRGQVAVNQDRRRELKTLLKPFPAERMECKKADDSLTRLFVED
jgi:hypothetical protein